MRTLKPSCGIVLYVQFHFISRIHLTVANSFFPVLPVKEFSIKGNINLGFLIGMSNFDNDKQECDYMLGIADDIHKVQIIEYMFTKTYASTSLPRNIKLGFVALDDCYMVRESLAGALTFMPQTFCRQPMNDTNRIKYEDVVGVVGCHSSAQTKAVARLLSQAQIPIISYKASSDDLSDKHLFPYFLRTATPDKHQFQALFAFIQKQSWTFVSIVYEKSPHGESGYSILLDLFEKNNMCFATVQKVSPLSTMSEIQSVAEQLVKIKEARVVILIAQRSIAQNVLSATAAFHIGTFIWVGSDGWGEEVEYMSGLENILLGSVVVSQPESPNYEYSKYFRTLTMDKSTNPWLRHFWEKHFNCTLARSCYGFEPLIHYLSYPYSDRIIDVIQVYINAISRVLESCRQADARKCITGTLLLQELYKTNYTRDTIRITFEDSGDYLGKYNIYQILRASGIQGKKRLLKVRVAEYDASTQAIKFGKDLIWNHHWLPTGMSAPDSKCSKPCAPAEATIYKEIKCCWACRPCRDNEYLTHNRTMCEACPLFTWPDVDTRLTTCKDIPIDIPGMGNTQNVLLVILSLALLSCCLAIFVFFHRNRDKRVIKASAQIMSYQMLYAISVGYVTIFLLQYTPNDVICRISYWFFCLSFSLLYGPLFVRAFCIYRIFDSASKSTKKPTFVGPIHQLILTSGVSLLQVVLCAIQMASYPDWHKKTMADYTVPYVELSCDMSMGGMTSFLAYNLLMLAVCSYLAYKTRFLPDNFNESRYISLCVSTTLLVWLTFIPSYLMAPREYIKTLMLTLALALNHSVALVFLFLPKIYAVLYVEQLYDQTRKSELFRTALFKSYNDFIHMKEDSKEFEQTTIDLQLKGEHTIRPPTSKAVPRISITLAPHDIVEERAVGNSFQKGMLTFLAGTLFNPFLSAEYLSPERSHPSFHTNTDEDPSRRSGSSKGLLNQFSGSLLNPSRTDSVLSTDKSGSDETVRLDRPPLQEIETDEKELSDITLPMNSPRKKCATKMKK